MPILRLLPVLRAAQLDAFAALDAEPIPVVRAGVDGRGHLLDWRHNHNGD